MDQDAIIRFISQTFPGVDVMQLAPGQEPAIAQGDTFFIYDPDRDLDDRRRQPFATIVTKDYGDFDRASNLDREGVFRLNIGVGKDTYRALFGAHPGPPADAGKVDTGHDFTALDRLMPHPIYAPQSWVCILNPSDARLDALRPLLAEAHAIAVARVARRASPSE